MPVPLSYMRDELMPGLLPLQWSFKESREILAANLLVRPATPHIWIPKLTIPQAIGVGAAAAVMQNPEVTRRFWAGWFS